MRIVVGNKKKDIYQEDITNIIKPFKSVKLDLGTGDGRFIYKEAIIDPNTLFIGIDPSEKQLEIYSKKSVKKKLNNCYFVVGSVEMLPNELINLIDEMFITLPWGTLLESIVKPTKESVLKISTLIKKGGKLEITLGYSPDFEPSETKRLDLPDIDVELIKNSIIPSFETHGFNLGVFELLDKDRLSSIETTWAKKLKFGKDRKIFRVVLSKSNV